MTRTALQMAATIRTPDMIRHQLEQGAALAISISGGKDSQALLQALVREHKAQGWTGRVFAIHADLGRMEWTQTPDVVVAQAEAADVELVVVQRAKGDLLARIRDRRAQLEGTGRPFWPSSAARYCTSDLKRDPIDKYLRTLEHVVVAMGLRADESSARAKKLPCQIRSRITTQARQAHDWNPILHWNEADVWDELGTSLKSLNHRREIAKHGPVSELLALAGWTSHPAYVFGNERLSCALCILASRSDLVNGARHNPTIFAELLDMERSSGCTFQAKLSLESIAAELDSTGHVPPC